MERTLIWWDQLEGTSDEGREGGRRPILLGIFRYRCSPQRPRDPRRDAVIPGFWPQRGPTWSRVRAARTPGPAEQCLLSPLETEALGL